MRVLHQRALQAQLNFLAMQVFVQENSQKVDDNLRMMSHVFVRLKWTQNIGWNDQLWPNMLRPMRVNCHITVSHNIKLTEIFKNILSYKP